MRRPKASKGNFAFIDNQNLNLGVQKAGWKMNWRRFREWLKDEYNVEQAYMFIGYMPEHEDLYELMHSLGFLVVLKPTLEMFHTKIEGAPIKIDNRSEEDKKDDKKPAVKGNVDAELVLYAVKEMPNYDKAVIISGDGDFFSLVEYLQQQNKLLHLMTPNWQYSSLLKVFDKQIIRLDQHKRTLQYHDRKRVKKPA